MSASIFSATNQWLMDMGRSLRLRGATGSQVSALRSASAAAATAAALAAGAYSVGAVGPLQAIAAELGEGVSGAGRAAAGALGSFLEASGEAGKGPVAVLPEWPRGNGPLDESSVDPFSLSPVDVSELDDLLLGAEAGEMMAACVAVTLEGHVADGALVEPQTKTRFPLMLYEDPHPIYLPNPGGYIGMEGDVDRLAPQPHGAAMAVGPGTLLTLAERPVTGHGGNFQEGPVRGDWGSGQMARLHGQPLEAPMPRGAIGPFGKGPGRRDKREGAKDLVDLRAKKHATEKSAALSPLQQQQQQQQDAEQSHRSDGFLAQTRTPSLEQRSSCQVLAGVGVRSRLIAKVKNLKIYAFGLYVHPERLRAELGSKYGAVPPEELKLRDEFYNDLLSHDVGMTVRLVVHYRGLTMDMVRRAFDTSLTNRLIKIAGHAEDQGLKVFNEYLSQPNIDISRGTTIDFSWKPGGKFITKIGGKTMEPIESPHLCRAFFDLYIGDPPVSAQAKEKIGESIARMLSQC